MVVFNEKLNKNLRPIFKRDKIVKNSFVQVLLKSVVKLPVEDTQ
jgi:hypothetical protein